MPKLYHKCIDRTNERRPDRSEQRISSVAFSFGTNSFAMIPTISGVA
jgi:hypothetical protein